MNKFLIVIVFILMPFLANAQFSISGQSNLTGANIYLKGTSKGTFSDSEGKFEIKDVKKGNYLLMVSFVGYQNFSKEIEVSSDLNLKIDLILDEKMTQEVVIFGKKDYPITQSELGQEEIKKLNLGQDLPILLNFTPSVVSTSDAGAGIGYTGMRIRGSDATRTNVTVNGIPLNDVESQGVFWVNMPDFASNVKNIQIQRGVGTSTNGAAAFGASMNIETNSPAENAYAEINNSYGSFNSWKNTLRFGTGLLKNRFSIDGRLSRIKSDGFIDRAFSDLKSFYVSGKYKGEKNSLTLNIFSGTERTYQAWNGVPEEEIRKGNRKFNEFTYENQTDNYQQDHYQLLYQQQITSNWAFNGALHYTKGRGFYEEFKTDQAFKKYGLANVISGKDTISQTDLIRRRWLDNDFYGVTYHLTYQSEEKLKGANRFDFHLGGAWNKYLGKHFGEIIWAKNASNSQIRQRYYDNDATKTDFNVFAKANYQLIENLFLFADLQIRKIGYQFWGFNRLLQNTTQSVDLTFFNPKFGLRFRKNESEYYFSYSVGNKEPNREDYTQSSPDSRPQAENLQNIEAGYSFSTRNLTFSANYYLMAYQNQLVLTGKINDVGAYIRQNIADSYRTGIELQANWNIGKFNWNANATFSRNKISKFVEYLDNYDNGTQQTIEYSNTDISFSPNLIASSQLSFAFAKNGSISVLSKYVDRQFLDNTSSSSRQLNAYFINDLRLMYAFKPSFMEEIGLNLMINNVFDVKYESNGYTFGYFYENQIQRSNYYYPQAGTNFMLALNLRF